MEPRTTRRFLVLLAALAVAIPLALSGGSALAVHDENLFELDEDAVDDPADEPDDDWDTLYNALPGGDALAFTFVVDGVEGDDPATPSVIETSDDDVFAQSSKDTNNINTWKWKDQFPEGKNDIENAYVAAYTNQDDELILYFGIDRMANNGDAALDGSRSRRVSAGRRRGQRPLPGGSRARRHPRRRLHDGRHPSSGSTSSCGRDTSLAPDAPWGRVPGASLFGGDLWRIFAGQDCDASGEWRPRLRASQHDRVTAALATNTSALSNQPPECAGLSGVQTIDVFPRRRSSRAAST
jgi:hypothetical protein